jgi:hypothetical protein
MLVVFDPSGNFVVNESPVCLNQFFFSKIFFVDQEQLIRKCIFLQVIHLLADYSFFFTIVADLVGQSFFLTHFPRLIV